MEAVFFPIPPDVVLLPLSVLRPELAPLFGVLATAGSVSGAALGYAIGLRGGRPLVHRLFRRERVQQVEDLFHRYDSWAIGIAGFTPVPYKVFALAAGVFGISFYRFIVASVLSRGARFMLEALLVMYFGQPIIGFISRHFGWITMVLFAAVALAYVVIVRRRGAVAAR